MFNKEQEILARVWNVLRKRFADYEDVFAHILVKRSLPVFEYGIDSINLNSEIFNVINKVWNIAFILLNYGKFNSNPSYFTSIVQFQWDF